MQWLGVSARSRPKTRSACSQPTSAARSGRELLCCQMRRSTDILLRCRNLPRSWSKRSSAPTSRTTRRCGSSAVAQLLAGARSASRQPLRMQRAVACAARPEPSWQPSSRRQSSMRCAPPATHSDAPCGRLHWHARGGLVAHDPAAHGPWGRGTGGFASRRQCSACRMATKRKARRSDVVGRDPAESPWRVAGGLCDEPASARSPLRPHVSKTSSTRLATGSIVAHRP